MRFMRLTSGLTAANCSPRRRVRLASVIFFLLALLAAGCIRSNMSLVVEEAIDGAPTAQLEVRTLFSPAWSAILGSAEWWDTIASDESLNPPPDSPLEGATWAISDPDGWMGVASDVRGPLENVLAVDILAQMGDEADGEQENTLLLEKTANRWNLNWQVGGTAGDDTLNEMETGPSEFPSEFLSELGTRSDMSEFEFNFSVTLPGSLVETNSEDVAETDESTTASWRITDPAGELFFELITEVSETQEDSSGSLNITWVLLIAFFGVVVITIFFFRVERKVSV